MLYDTPNIIQLVLSANGQGFDEIMQLQTNGLIATLASHSTS